MARIEPDTGDDISVPDFPHYRSMPVTLIEFPFRKVGEPRQHMDLMPPHRQGLHKGHALVHRLRIKPLVR